MAIYALGDKRPTINNPETCWQAPTAIIIGDVTLEQGSSVWFSAVLRGDNEPIMIGARSNVQEAVVMHTDPGYPLVLEEGCTIGHQAMLHGCTIRENSLIGMGATILNGAVIGRNSLVGAHTLIPENKVYPDGSLILGTPGRVARALTDQEIARLRVSAQRYVEKASQYKTDLEVIG
ncbi:MAG: gamma carbonic anhydrase family protein [Rhodomicrobium sp.]|nr:MAG: gamma carbonic anhydrase family protein [Rhodomicrobium sp.]